MRPIIVILSVLSLVFATASGAGEVPIRLDGEQVAVGEVISREAADVIGLDEPSHTPLLVVESPPVGRRGARLSGFVESIDVDSVAWLELWALYADGTRSVARTLDRNGPELQLAGTTERRRFALPVALGVGGARPQRLELNVGMFGTGIVSVSELRLEHDEAEPRAARFGLSPLRLTASDLGSGFLSAPALLGAAGFGLVLRSRMRSRAAEFVSVFDPDRARPAR
jgi:hypothetical protein